MNFVGTVRLVNAIRPLLAERGRVVIVASDGHALGEVRFEDLPLHRFDSVQPSLATIWSNQAQKKKKEERF